MKDRVATYPGRVNMVPVEGLPNTYTLTWADEPTQEGTPLNKASFLPDSLALYMGLAQEDPVVADALRHLAEQAAHFCTIFVGTDEPGADFVGKTGDEYIQSRSGGVVVWKCTGDSNGYEWTPLVKTSKTMKV